MYYYGIMINIMLLILNYNDLIINIKNTNCVG